MIAGLLHDIGHGPFSHTFEDLFVAKSIRHEDWTPFFLNEYRTELFFREYNRINKHHSLSDENFQWIADMIMHQKPRHRLLADIVSSQLDADRLDYLLRDSHFCGVAYGEYDFRWMLNSMAVIETKDGPRLGLTHKGIGVVEHYLMARRLMVKNIYLHQKKLAFESFLIHLLANLAENIESDAILKEIKNTSLGKFLREVNQFNQNPSEQNKKTFLTKNFPIYKELCDYDVFFVIKTLAEMQNKHPAIDLAKRLQRRQMPKIVRLDHVNVKEVETLINDFKEKNRENIKPWQLQIIKTPHQSYTLSEDPILIINENGKVTPLNEISIMIDAISGKLEEVAFLSMDETLYTNKKLQAIIFAVINRRQ